MQQRQHEENLRMREQELAAREIDLLERELTVMIIQHTQNTTPTPNKRRGKFKKSRLRLNKKEPGSNISAPSGMEIIYSFYIFFYSILQLILCNVVNIS